MYSMTFKLNGKTIREVVADDGTRTYYPPLTPDESALLQKKFKKNVDGICESRKFPGLRTDTEFLANRGSLVKQLGGDERWAKHIASEAKKRGHNVGSNDVYISQLAEFPGDPRAFLSAGDGRAKIEKICRERGLDCRGSVNVTSEKKEIKPIRLAEDLVQEQMQLYRQNGDETPDAELREKVIETHGQKVD
jgi:hypothetical protein